MSDSETDESTVRFDLNILDDGEWYSNEPSTSSTRPGRMFERYRNQQRQSTCSSSTATAAATTSTPATTLESAASGDTSQCTCHKCQSWENMRACERSCCRSIPKIMAIMTNANIRCFTEHTDFDILCFNPSVLKVAASTFDRDERKMYIQSLPQHKRLRYLAYSNITRFVYGTLGKGNRVPLPACVVHKIRSHYVEGQEAEEYTEFSYDDEDEDDMQAGYED
jgi:hypothetical protein